VATKNPISHKYLNHGMYSVPAQKCSNHNKYNQSLNFCLFPVYPPRDPFRNHRRIPEGDSFIKVRAYSTSSPKDTNDSNVDQFIPAAVYEDAFTMKKAILKDNAGKVGIYMLTNKLTGDIYVGQSINLRKRFLNYFNLSYLSRRNELRITRAILKYGYLNFSVTILEYCDKCELEVREQHYFDTLNPQYNIQKVAGGSSKGLILSEETKNKISQALKGVYVGGKSYWYGRSMSAATKEIMSSTRKGELNPLYGKSHSEATKELIRQKALGRKFSEETKLLMSSKRGNPVNIYEKCTSEGFELIGSFVSYPLRGLEKSG
jgi:group I intron endonuclease